MGERGLVQNLMRGGLILSALLMGAGILAHLLTGDLDARGIEMGAIFSGELAGADFLLTAGVFVLALTPAFRVLTLMIFWATEKDWRFAGIAVLVAGALLLSIGLGGH